jgi:spermidine synthase
MIPWQLLDRVRIPDSRGELTLHQRGEELSIRIDGAELMNSRLHGSEDALAELSCARIAAHARVRVLIGGLGMGFTLAKALQQLAADAEVVMAELVPSVVAWNHAHLGHLAGHPLRDPRVQVRELDVGLVLREQSAAFDAILLDVDNGPAAFTVSGNTALYSDTGIATAFAALKPNGVLAVWSAREDKPFEHRLRQAKFAVTVEHASAASKTKGSRHTIYLAHKSKLHLERPL